MADQNNPWDTTPAADSAAQSADAWGTPATAPTDGGGADWLTSTPAPNVEHFNILDPFHKTLIPLDSWVTEGIDWVVTHFRPVFQGVRVPVDYILNGFQQLLLGMPAPVAIIVFALIAWQISGVGMGVATLVSLRPAERRRAEELLAEIRKLREASFQPLGRSVDVREVRMFVGVNAKRL